MIFSKRELLKNNKDNLSYSDYCACKQGHLRLFEADVNSQCVPADQVLAARSFNISIYS